jgi:DNA-binding PadR family transcriptional regulator
MEHTTRTTSGKSDVFEAVVQVLILIFLHECGTADGPSIVEEMQRKTAGLIYVEEASGYIALLKLEASGWIKNKRSTATPRTGVYVLTKSASTHLHQEMKEWRDFVDHWPQINYILNGALRI